MWFNILSMLIPSLTYVPTYKVRGRKIARRAQAAYASEIYGLYLCRFAFSSCNELPWSRNGAKGFSVLRCSVVVLPSDKDLVFAFEHGD